ncbi:hypothetical protein pb186bvf_001224 [Paramecium bursaria]
MSLIGFIIKIIFQKKFIQKKSYVFFTAFIILQFVFMAADLAQLASDLDKIDRFLHAPQTQESLAQLDRKQFINMAVLNILLHFFFGGLFYWFSTSEARYESPDCESLRFFSYIYALVTLTIIIFHVFILLVACCTPEGVSDVRQIYNWLNFFYAFISFFLFIFIYVALFKNEPCGDLRILVMICFVITLSILFCCCCICMSGAMNQQKVQ